MSASVDRFGRPTNLEQPNEMLEGYEYDSMYGHPYRKLRADREASFEDAMLMISILIKQYEYTFSINAHDNKVLLMPHLLSAPEAGTKITNKQTGEVYTVKESILSPVTRRWEGLVRLNAIAGPDPLLAHRLDFVDHKNGVRFIEEYPSMVGNEGQTPEGIIVDKGPMAPTIVYSLVRKEPGSIGKTPFGPQKEYKKHVREQIKDTNILGSTIEVRAQAFDNLVQFDCCTTDNISSTRLVKWFERFMNLYEGVLKKNGVQQILYWQRLKDAAVTKWRQDLVVRTVQYYFRTEEIEAVIRGDLRKIDFNVDLGNSLENDSERYIAGQLVTGLITEEEYRALFRDSTGKYLFGNTYINDGNLS